MRRELEHLIHPLVFADMERFFTQAEADGNERAVAEVPLWHESRKPDVDAVVVTVTCPGRGPARPRARRAGLERRASEGRGRLAVVRTDKIARRTMFWTTAARPKSCPARFVPCWNGWMNAAPPPGPRWADTLRALWGERVTASVRGRPDEEGVLS